MESGDADEIALWAVRAATAWSMLVFHRDLENHVWAGYQHNTAIYGIAAGQRPNERRSRGDKCGKADL
ncbi:MULTISPECIES: hypothetical protein [Kribbella]|nr:MULTISPECIES: hypothetical protein [Kribbella]